MTGIRYMEISSNPGYVSLGNVPVLDYSDFYDQTIMLLKKSSCHCLNYYTYKSGDLICFIILIANDDSHRICIYSHRQPAGIRKLPSITRECLQLHVFEREIYENTGITFEGHPFLKPVRYAHDNKNVAGKMSDYPFYRIDSDEIHEVGVGPIHAGVIEPGHFRFQCHGERVLHLEIQLGYQHRGVEKIFTGTGNLLKLSILSESIAGDTAAGHGLAFSQLAETLAGRETSGKLGIERIIALEMERMAVHIGDTAALCGDVAFQIGQVASEALRTVVINTMQDWCGNRFGKGLIRPGGTNYPLVPQNTDLIVKKLTEVRRRFSEVTDLIFNNSGIIGRFENIGTLSRQQSLLSGTVGMAARSSGLIRDIRASHPFGAYQSLHYKPAHLDSGDVYARALLRQKEFELSFGVINELISKLSHASGSDNHLPDYSMKFLPGILAVSLTEGWRGEICHSAVTGSDGRLLSYKVKDPSLHNWYALALAVRGQEISDFPVCNKSFNLSYCGNDL